jgi:RND family efflux transporter MFP subunit
VERRALDLERTLSGALEAESQVVVAPKVGGRIERLAVDLADPVQRGQAVAFLDDAEYAQEVKQAEAELAVAMANLAQARNALEISHRENQRIVTLRERGIASDSEYDIVDASRMEKEAQVEVAEAQVNRATAALESSRIRYEYTRVTADWSEGDAERRVAERFVEEGGTVSANEPLLLIVQLDPIMAVISATERDYGRLRPGLEARFTTDAFPGEEFRGRIERIAPVFRESSRQARVELTLANPEGRLKPGMFIRATITLDHVEEAVAVPEAALTRRGDAEGVFLVDESGERVRWVPVETGIRSRGWAQLRTPSLSGRVVTLGQHLIDDGSAIRIVSTFDPGSTP